MKKLLRLGFSIGLGALCIGILTLVAEWMIFKKMGRQGWEGIVPFYNT